MDDRLHDPIRKLSDGVVAARKKTLGFRSEDLSKPVIGIINSYSELNLAQLSFGAVAQRVREGVLMAGGMPIESGMIALCDSMAHGRLHEKYVLPGRDIMADSIETYVNAHGVFDGLVFIGTCDKVLPAMLIAAIRVDVPAVVVTGGPQIPELNHDVNQSVCADIRRRRRLEVDPERIGDEKYIKSLYLDELISEEEFVDLYYSTNSTIGICRPYATAGTMNYFTEALGLALSGSALVPELSTEKALRAKDAGVRAVELARRGIRPSSIVNEKSVENAIRSVIASGGSMNAILHALAVANTAGVELDYSDIARLSSSTPFLIDLKNQHTLNMTLFRSAGGVLGVLKRLGRRIHRDVMTVDGVELGTLLDGLPKVGSAIADEDRALAPEGGIRVLRGSLAPRGALFNASNVPRDRLGLSEVRPAAVYDSYESFAADVATRALDPRAAVVIRFEGPIGGPGMREAHRVSEVINHLNLLNNDFVLITDGRFSGASNGFIIGYLAPEAAEAGSPLALVRNGDPIEICLPTNRLDLLVDEAELARRAAEGVPSPPPVPREYPYLRRYRRLVGPTDRGALVS
ncbi:dihydroxy-acid dehydratase [Microbispora rosea subsp. aerata]|nr:dihydroxy-acid dehydratase [Microbispora rosea]GGO11538.1 dihydroxy-acid dehydratase [Microbispora rosea subsp. aerata]GIH55751.1 dihydroxy-acid dehydratase [Microbispora rosea subsp. aerata]GLJ85951.1 dihydroxy-acid dehydratase [Microbispora rosea subsp. aerata]